ncbi:hypothetical protein D1007_27312 [Hordeum vulgare]|nr:hypothetical protein D1007_27312 [Hordeum vulgare]
MFQSLGIGAIVSMIRNSNAREYGSAASCYESVSAITQAGSSDYNPKDDEVIDGEEVDDQLVKKKGKANFEMDTESSVIQYACTDIWKNSLCNRRHHVKKEYFDKVEGSKVSIKSPVSDITDTEWQWLVELWSSPRHKETCANNKVNRTKVKFAQKTGSRCYVAHVHATEEERKGEVLSAFNIFKATHNNTKHGFSEDVEVAITEMEEKMTARVQEGEEQKSFVSIVAEVLTKHRPSSKFLKNVGLQPNSTDKSSKSNAAVNARVLDLQEQLEMSHQRSEVMGEEMHAMKRKEVEAEAAQAERDKSYELLLKKAEENNVK